MAVLRGNLAPRGAVIKQSAASPKLLQHTGRAVVFESVEDMTLRIDDPDLDVNADDVLVLRNAGPKGAPGMPEAGYLPIPKKLARGGVKDMVRISDARMSGTAFGTIVLHITPESAVGGPLALVQERRHDPARRRRNAASICWSTTPNSRSAARRWRRPSTPDWAKRGYAQLFNETSCRPTKAAISISCAARARTSAIRAAVVPANAGTHTASSYRSKRYR